ncbi:MAG: class I SAM-dependent methyltransferase [Halodesulfovibrio sp.]|uniref:class I SAM-dependent methyltransferase n=1 Tax=Halodesulfovibrio sp. TaxID=1912772 RepID=UPI00359E0854
MSEAFDPAWEAIYQNGHNQNYPWDSVITFYFQYRSLFGAAPRVLEVGCGTGSNIRALAGEGAVVTGVDGSVTAITDAKKRFEQAGVNGDLLVKDFTQISYPPDSFDMAIDRGSIYCCSREDARKAVQLIADSMVKGGVFFMQMYSKKHSHYTSAKNGLDEENIEPLIVAGGCGTFYSEEELRSLFSDEWEFVEFDEVVKTSLFDQFVHSAFNVVAKKK